MTAKGKEARSFTTFLQRISLQYNVMAKMEIMFVFIGKQTIQVGGNAHS